MNINNYIKYHYKDALHVARLAGANVYNNEFTKLVNLKYIRFITRNMLESKISLENFGLLLN